MGSDGQRRVSAVAARLAKFEKNASNGPPWMAGASTSDLNSSSGSMALSNSSSTSLDFNEATGDNANSPAVKKKPRARPNLPAGFLSPGAGSEPSEAESKKRRPWKSKSMPRAPMSKMGASMSSGLSATDSVPAWKKKLLEQKKKRSSFMHQSMASLGDSDDDFDLGIIDESSPTATSSKKKVSDDKIEDVKIEVNMNPEIQKKLRQRQRPKGVPKKSVSAFSYSSLSKSSNNNEGHIPEHIRLVREKEAARKAALDEKARVAEVKVHAVVLGWYRRLQYPKLRAAHQDKLRQIAEKARLEKHRHDSATKIQAVVRRYPARKNFRRHWASVQKRIETIKRIKEMEKKANLIPEQTKAEIAKMKKEYHDKNSSFQRAMMKQVKADIKKHDEAMKEIKKAGKTETEYIKQENQRIREEMAVIVKDMKLLQKQAKVLESKSSETQERFKSLEQWCKKKQESNQKKKISEEKCRHRYLPKYRRDLAGKNQECIVENRVKEIYKKLNYKVVDELQARSSDSTLTSEIVGMILSTEQELEETLGDYEPPEQLQKWLGW